MWLASLSVCADPGSEPEYSKAERVNEHQYKLYKSCKMQQRICYILQSTVCHFNTFEVNKTAQNRIVFFFIKCKNIKHMFFQQQVKEIRIVSSCGATWAMMFLILLEHHGIVTILQQYLYYLQLCIETVNKEVYVIWCFGFLETQLS